MQLFVLGTPRSGTSVIARTLTLMGANFGPPHQSVGASNDNASGTWERRDVRSTNDKLLNISGCAWDQVSTFCEDNLHTELILTQSLEAKEIIIGLDKNQPWMLKDPSFCLLLPFWLRAASNPCAVITYRHPVAAARSLHVKNQIPLHVGIALWEHYLVSALNASRNIPRTLINLDDICENTVAASNRLRTNLEGIGVSGLTKVREELLDEYFDPDRVHHHCGIIESVRYLSAAQQDLHEAMLDESILDLRTPLEVSDESQEVLAAFEAEREWLNASLEDERSKIKLQLNSLQTQLKDHTEASLKLKQKRDDALFALTSVEREKSALDQTIRVQESELRSTSVRLELQEDKLRVAAHWLEKASEHHAILAKTRRWRFLSSFSKLKKLITGRESEYDKSVNEMKQLEQSLRSFLPTIGASSRALEVEVAERSEESRPALIANSRK